MASQTYIRRNMGGMDYDSAPEYVDPNDYRDALNVRGQSDVPNGDKRIEIIKGTEIGVPSFSIPPTVGSSKEYVISDIDGVSSYQLKLFYSNRSTMVTTATFNTPAQLIAQLGLWFVLPQYVLTTSSTATSVTFSVQAQESTTAYNGFEFFVINVGAAEATIVCSREAIPDSISGNHSVIGSEDLVNDLFIFSTPNEELPSDATCVITGITNGLGVNAEVTTDIPHGLSTLDVVQITGVVGIPEANGVHVIVVSGANTFKLLGVQTSGSYTSGGAIKLNPISVGQISVAQKDRNTGSWTCVRLIASKDFNFRRKKQIDVAIEKDASKVSVYFVDDYNTDRVFYYVGDYITDGALSNVVSTGQYLYGTIGEEIKLTASVNSLTIDFVGQLSSGGSLLDGNYRYTCRLRTKSGATTNWIPLSSIINVGLGDKASPKTLKGGIEGSDNTGKVNLINITGVNGNIFDEIEVVFVHYFGSAFSAGLFYRGPIGVLENGISVSHTGNESVENIDIGSLNLIDAFYDHSKNIRILDNRLIRSNLVTQAQYNFTSFTESITYSLDKYDIRTAVSYDGEISYNEYLDPGNTFDHVGYMLNETYRFAFSYELYDGYRTQPFWTGYDVTFDTTPAGPSTPGREPGGELTNYDLSPVAGLTTWLSVPYIKFTIPDLDTFISDGIRFRDIVKRIHILRAEVTNPTVLASGIIALGVSGTLGGPAGVTIGSMPQGSATGVVKKIAETYNLYYGASVPIAAAFGADAAVAYPPSGTINSFVAEDDVCSFYSGDILLDNISVEYVTGDKIKIIGEQSIVETVIGFDNGATTTPTPNTQHPNFVVHFLSDAGANATTDHIVSAKYDLAQGEIIPIGGTDGFTKKISFAAAANEGAYYEAQKSWVIKTSTGMALSSGATYSPITYGVYYAQYFRELINQYGNVETNKFIYTGSHINIDSNTLSTGNVVSAFGGDTFTQTTYIKSISPSDEPRPGYTDNLWQGRATMTNWIGQNRCNFHMRGDGENPPDRPDPALHGHFPSEVTKERWLTRRTDYPDIYVYNQGYNIRNQINEYRAFDESLNLNSDLPATIAYSDIKAQGSQVDSYRVFLPLNRKDLDLSYGEIMHHEVFNGELVTIQNRKFQRQFFNTTGILTTAEGAEVIMGDGAALTRRGNTISSYGTRNKWSVVKGKSNGGNDVIYWFDSENGVVMRLGYDGSVPISIRHNMDSFFRNQSRFAFDKDTPADDQGVHGVWNEQFREFILTSRCRMDGVDDYNPANPSTAGSVYKYTDEYSTYEQTGEFIVCIQNALVGETPATNPEKWLVVPHSDTNYYNEYAIVWSEGDNRFKCMISPKPKIYLRYSNTILAPDPLSPKDIYEFNKVEYAKWFNGLEEDAFIVPVFNEIAEEQKTLEAISIDSNTVVDRVEFTTRGQESYLDSSEFELREEKFQSPIKNDSTVSGINSSDTSRLYGRAGITKVIMASGAYNWIRSVAMKMRVRSRLLNR